VSGFWLTQYLSPKQREATASLSLFAATFAADRAAAVMHGAAAGAEQRDDAVNMLRGLRGVSVLQAVTAPQPDTEGHSRYSMHLLIRDLAVELRAKQLQHGDADDTAASGFLSYMLHRRGAELIDLDGTAANAAVAARLLGQETQNFAAMLHLVAAPDRHRARAMLEDDSQHGTACRDLMTNLAVALAEWGQLQLAEQVGRAALTASRQWPDQPDTMTSMSNLGVWLSDLGQYEAAADIARQALTARQGVLGPEHPATLTSMSNLSGYLGEQGQHRAAADMARQVLDCWQRVLGSEHVDTLSSMSKLSVWLGDLGQHKEAAAMGWQALTARQRVLGREHPNTLSSMSNLSICLAKLDQHEEAASMARQALAVRKRVLRPDHPDTLESMSSLSLWLAHLGHDAEAADMAQQALTAQQRVLGLLEHPGTLTIMANLEQATRGPGTGRGSCRHDAAGVGGAAACDWA